MAETALVTVGPEQIPIPVGCRPRQVKLARLSLERDADSEESLAQLLRDAGYADATAYASARRTLQSAGVQRAKAALILRQSDSALSIKKAVLPHVAAHVKPGMDLTDALNVLGVVSKVAADYPDEDPGVGEGERQSALDYIRNVVKAVLVASGVSITSGNYADNLDQLIDTIALKVDSGELTEYGLSDVASPPADAATIEASVVTQPDTTDK